MGAVLLRRFLVMETAMRLRLLLPRLVFVLIGFPVALTAGWLNPEWSSADEPTARVPWTTSRVVGSPDPPPPYKSVRVFGNVKFDKPLLMARCPGSDRHFVGEQEGKLYSLANRADAT